MKALLLGLEEEAPDLGLAPDNARLIKKLWDKKSATGIYGPFVSLKRKQKLSSENLRLGSISFASRTRVRVERKRTRSLNAPSPGYHLVGPYGAVIFLAAHTRPPGLPPTRLGGDTVRGSRGVLEPYRDGDVPVARARDEERALDAHERWIVVL